MSSVKTISLRCVTIKIVFYVDGDLDMVTLTGSMCAVHKNL